MPLASCTPLTGGNGNGSLWKRTHLEATDRELSALQLMGFSGGCRWAVGLISNLTSQPVSDEALVEVPHSSVDKLWGHSRDCQMAAPKEGSQLLRAVQSDFLAKEGDMKRLLAMIVSGIFCCGIVQAADFNGMVDQAKANYQAGKKVEAVERLKDAVLAIWDEVPLTVRNVRLVTDQEKYATRPNDVYRSGEKIYIACQLLGYKMKKAGDAYAIDVVTDFLVLDEAGKVLGGVQEFGTFSLVSFIPTTDFRLDLTYTLTDAPAGVYQLQTVINDKNSNKSTKFIQKVRIK